MGEEKYEFRIEKECKHSRRYMTVDKTCPIQTVYVDKEYSGGKGSIYITITDA